MMTVPLQKQAAMWAWLVPLLLRAGCPVLDPRFPTAAPECRPPAVGLQGGEVECSAEELVLHKLRLCADAGIFRVRREPPHLTTLATVVGNSLYTFSSKILVRSILYFASTQSPHVLSLAYTDEPVRSLRKPRFCLQRMHSCRLQMRPRVLSQKTEH